MVWLGSLIEDDCRQLDLFEDTPARQTYGKLDEAIDRLNAQYGQSVVVQAATLGTRLKAVHPRDAAPERHKALMPGETKRRLGIPRMTLGNPV